VPTPSSKDVALAFFDLAFVKKDPATARRELIGDVYVQHNPGAPDGPEGFVEMISGLFARAPAFRTELRHVVAEDDMVALHHHAHLSEDGPGVAVIDLFRIKDGKVVEHWDVVQPVPETSANSNAMF